MAGYLDRKLLETDLERIIAMCTPEEISVECDAGGEDCIAMTRNPDAPTNQLSPQCREYVIVRRDDYSQMLRELNQFARRWKEIYG